jgi:hypothetical protein
MGSVNERSAARRDTRAGHYERTPGTVQLTPDFIRRIGRKSGFARMASMTRAAIRASAHGGECAVIVSGRRPLATFPTTTVPETARRSCP